MFNAKSNVLILAIMLIAFLGQALAFNGALSCETPNVADTVFAHTSSANKTSESGEPITHNNQKPENTALSTHADTNDAADCCGVECCNADCLCSANTCSSFTYSEIDIGSSKSELLSEAVVSQQSQLPKSIVSLLYRPPIFTS